MCLLISKPRDIKLDYDEMKLAWYANPDGIGVTIREGKRLYTNKQLVSDFDVFWQSFEPLQKHEALVHFRFATHGAVNLENCHPFSVAGRYSVGHNGVIHGYGNKRKSDTRDWIEKVLEPLLVKYPGLVYESAFQTMLGAILEWSKLVILGTKKEPVIINEQAGYWERGVWYSNFDHRIFEQYGSYGDWEDTRYGAAKEGECLYCGAQCAVVEDDLCQTCKVTYFAE